MLATAQQTASTSFLEELWLCAWDCHCKRAPGWTSQSLGFYANAEPSVCGLRLDAPEGFSKRIYYLAVSAFCDMVHKIRALISIFVQVITFHCI